MKRSLEKCKDVEIYVSIIILWMEDLLTFFIKGNHKMLVYVLQMSELLIFIGIIFFSHLHNDECLMVLRFSNFPK